MVRKPDGANRASDETLDTAAAPVPNSARFTGFFKFHRDGDPLEIVTRIERVFIDGRAADPGNKHRRLYDRYRAGPQIAAR